MFWKPTFDVIILCIQVLCLALVFQRVIKISVLWMNLGAQFVEKFVLNQHRTSLYVFDLWSFITMYFISTLMQPNNNKSQENPLLRGKGQKLYTSYFLSISKGLSMNSWTKVDPALELISVEEKCVSRVYIFSVML